MNITAEMPGRFAVPECNADTKTESLLHAITPVSLAQCNALASMQDRVDNKYLVDAEQLRLLLALIRSGYSVLEIEGKRHFRYSSCYYDDHFRCYLEHHQGRRQRLKVRTREYVDGGGQKYFEIKLKGTRGRTVKHRRETAHLIVPEIEGEQLRMLRDLYSGQYRKELALTLRPALMVGYRRCTLVAVDGGERVTIDSHLTFANPESTDQPIEVGSNFIIVETKSSNGKGAADSALKSLKIRGVSKCSKYCIGANLTGGIHKNNTFLPAIRRARQNMRATQG